MRMCWSLQHALAAPKGGMPLHLPREHPLATSTAPSQTRALPAAHDATGNIASHRPTFIK